MLMVTEEENKMKTIITLLFVLVVSPLNIDEDHEFYLAMPHTHQVEKPEKIGQMSKKVLQFVK